MIIFFVQSGSLECVQIYGFDFELRLIVSLWFEVCFWASCIIAFGLLALLLWTSCIIAVGWTSCAFAFGLLALLLLGILLLFRFGVTLDVCVPRRIALVSSVVYFWLRVATCGSSYQLYFWLRAAHRQAARRIDFTLGFELLLAARRIDS